MSKILNGEKKKNVENIEMIVNNGIYTNQEQRCTKMKEFILIIKLKLFQVMIKLLIKI